MIQLETKVLVKNVTPKSGKYGRIEVKLDIAYTEETLLDLTKMMMQGQGDVEATFAFDDTPLFPEEDDDQMDLVEDE